MLSEGAPYRVGRDQRRAVEIVIDVIADGSGFAEGDVAMAHHRNLTKRVRARL